MGIENSLSHKAKKEKRTELKNRRDLLKNSILQSIFPATSYMVYFTEYFNVGDDVKPIIRNVWNGVTVNEQVIDMMDIINEKVK